MYTYIALHFFLCLGHASSPVFSWIIRKINGKLQRISCHVWGVQCVTQTRRGECQDEDSYRRIWYAIIWLITYWLTNDAIIWSLSFTQKIKALVSGREHSATEAEVVKAKAATLNQRPTPSPLSLSKSILLSFWTSGVCREEMNCGSQHPLTHTSRLIAYWYRISKVLWKWFSVWGPCVSGRDCFAETQALVIMNNAA